MPMIRLPRRLSLLHIARTRAPRGAAATVVLLAWVFLTQTLLIVHRIEHSNAVEAVTCALCVAADRLAADVPDTPHAIDGPDAASVELNVSAILGIPALVSYRSRAPPEHLQA
jgi:hypothetical protein